jgi:hypothetical protein
MTTITKVTHGTKALIAGATKYETLFIFGSVEGCQTENNVSAEKWGRAPYRTVAEALALAQSRGHEIAWVSPEAGVICGDKGYYEGRAAELKAALRLSLGDVVEIENRLYTLAPANNQNVRLIPLGAL